MEFRFPLAIIAVAMLVSGCASMSAEDCSVADWRSIGLSDGQRGELLSKADRRSKDCGKHGVAMDRLAYEAGRNEGLSRYCIESTGYELGESGRAYNGVCVEHGEAAFLAAFDRGREYRSFSMAVVSAADSLSTAHRRHDELDAKLDKYWSGYRDEGLTAEEHNNMVLDLWAERKYLAEKAIPYWTQAQDTAQRELDDYRQKIASGDPSLGSLRPSDFAGPEPYSGPTKEDARAMLQEVFSTIGQASRDR
ncbi:MAG: DUF2799 domain-containing protein [Pseudomonadales bacterium]